MNTPALPLSKRLHRRMAWLMDDVCFGVINFLHGRHTLPTDFAEKVEQYVARWASASVEDYYRVPVAAMDRGLAELRQYGGGPGRVAFTSPLESGVLANDRALFDFFPCSAGWTAPTMILAHGLMSVNDVGYRLWAKSMNSRGWNAIFTQLPFHYRRCPPGRISGEMAVGPDIIRSMEGVRQSVQELQVILRWLEEQGGTLTGAWGASYGGWVCGVLGCVDPRLRRLILLEPVLDLNHAIWHCPGTASLRAALVRRGVRPETIQRHMRLSCPSFMDLQVDPRHVILMAGEYDRITPVAEVERLHRTWKGSHFHVSAQGHVGHQMMPKSLKMAEELWPEDFPQLSVDLGLVPEELH